MLHAYSVWNLELPASKWAVSCILPGLHVQYMNSVQFGWHVPMCNGAVIDSTVACIVWVEPEHDKNALKAKLFVV